MKSENILDHDIAKDLSDVDLPTIWGRLNTIFESFIQQLPAILIGVTIFAIFIIIASIFRRIVRKIVKVRNKDNLGIVLGRVIQWVIIFLGLLVTLATILPSITAGKIISALGIGGIAVGFAFKDILQNFLAGILILIKEPFKLGDQIIYKNFEGTVTNVETRATYLKTYSGTQIIIPNGEIYTNPITVNTAEEAIRSEYIVGIGYGDDINQAIDIIIQTIKDTDGVVMEPAPDVIVTSLSENYIGLTARWWSSSMRYETSLIFSKVLKNIKLALDEASIDMPFPTQVVLFHDQTEDIDGNRTKQREGWPPGKLPPKPRRKS